MSRIYDSQTERKLDSPLTKVPTSYVCNRCKGRGHYVGDCPTNDDPTYDMVAGIDYVCKFCKERATHYFLFCPKNPDPNSIYRRRQEQSQQNVPQSHLYSNMALGKTYRATQSSPQPSPSAKSTRCDVDMLKVPSTKVDFELFTNDKRRDSQKMATGRLRFEKDDEDMDTDTDCTSIIYSQLGDGNKNKISRTGRLEAPEFADSELFWENISNEIHTNRSRGAQKRFEALTELTADQTACTPAATVANNQSPHTEFISQLFTKHPNQRNPMYRTRKRALDMWDINDRKWRQLEADDKSALSEQNLPIQSHTSNVNEMKIIHEYHNIEGDESTDTGYESINRQSKQCVEQVDFITDMKDYQEQKEYKSEQTESPEHQQKLNAIRRKINSIENLRIRLEFGDDVDPTEMQQMASGNLSQEVLDNLASRLQTQNAPLRS